MGRNVWVWLLSQPSVNPARLVTDPIFGKVQSSYVHFDANTLSSNF